MLRSWVELSIKEDATTKAFLKVSIRCIVGNSETTLFWMDPWLDDRCIAEWALDLVAIIMVHHRG
jgi:hypothetical protein